MMWFEELPEDLFMCVVCRNELDMSTLSRFGRASLPKILICKLCVQKYGLRYNFRLIGEVIK